MTPEQLTEADKTLKFIKQMEAIIRTSTSTTQVERVKKEVRKYREKMALLLPGIKAATFRVEDVRAMLEGVEVSGSSSTAAADRGAASGSSADSRRLLSAEEEVSPYQLVEEHRMERACSRCTDSEINLMYTVLRILEREYWPAITDQHCKLAYSHSSQRELLRKKLDGAFRNLKILTETIEEYAGAENQDFREQLQKMKSKQGRAFLLETNDILRQIRDFLRELKEDCVAAGLVVLNRNDVLQFSSRLEEASVLSGMGVCEAIDQFYRFIDQSIRKLNLPEFRAKG